MRAEDAIAAIDLTGSHRLGNTMPVFLTSNNSRTLSPFVFLPKYEIRIFTIA